MEPRRHVLLEFSDGTSVWMVVPFVEPCKGFLKAYDYNYGEPVKMMPAEASQNIVNMIYDRP